MAEGGPVSTGLNETKLCTLGPSRRLGNRSTKRKVIVVAYSDVFLHMSKKGQQEPPAGPVGRAGPPRPAPGGAKKLTRQLSRLLTPLVTPRPSLECAASGEKAERPGVRHGHTASSPG